MNNPYDVLGVSKDASKEEIKQAWKRLAMKHHPDRGGSDEKLAEINAAYDKVKNGDYQEPFQGGRRRSPFHGEFTQEDIEELLRRARYQHQMQVSVRVPIPIEVAIMGDKVPLDLHIQGKQFTVEVEVPPGTVRGDAVRYPGLINGVDVIIIYEVQGSSEWALEGNNLVKKQDISVWDLMLGVELDVKLIDNSVIRLKVPAGTQPNTIMRVPGKGVPSRDGFSAPGHLMVILNARIPKDIPEEILKAIRENKS